MFVFFCFFFMKKQHVVFKIHGLLYIGFRKASLSTKNIFLKFTSLIICAAKFGSLHVEILQIFAYFIWGPLKPLAFFFLKSDLESLGIYTEITLGYDQRL